jgi:hypothetical protein
MLVVADRCERESTFEMVLRGVVVAVVVCHPPGHFEHAGTGVEGGRCAGLVNGAYQTGSDLVLEVGDDGGVQLGTAEPGVSKAERMHYRLHILVFWSRLQNAARATTDECLRTGVLGNLVGVAQGRLEAGTNITWGTRKINIQELLGFRPQ